MGRPGRAACAAVLAAALSVAGCTARDPNPPVTPQEPEAALRLTTVGGAGALEGAARARAESAVGDVLSDYIVAAFLGDYPREDFVRSFESFTGGLSRRAARDIVHLTGERFADAEAVRARRLDARLSFVVVGDDVVGATASVRFEFEATVADDTESMELDGRLLLVEQDGVWSVFGYDVTTTDGTVVEGRVSS